MHARLPRLRATTPHVTASTMRPSLTWRRVATASPPGLPRSGAVAWPTPDGGALLFGGYTEQPASLARAPANDLWRLDPGLTGWSRVDTPNPPRQRLVAVAAAAGGYGWLLGGWDPGARGDGGDILGDVARLDLATGAWAAPAVANADLFPPTSRAVGGTLLNGALIVVVDHRVADRGGVLALDIRDADRPAWRVVPARGPPPPARGLAAAAVLSPTTLHVSCGAPRTGGMLADAWTLTLDDDGKGGEWRQAPPPPPPARAAHAVGVVADALILFGGARHSDTGLLPLGDTHASSPPGHGAWAAVAPAGGGPSPRNAAATVQLPGGRLLLAGGWAPFRESYDDTWVLEGAA